ncbi:MAG: hypothetical protein LBT95_05350 [Treponema sp.]|jgi:beta-mannanase|nr:hypothetical protein [Treponema sp.]
MLKRSLYVTGVVSLAVLIFLAACHNPAGPDTTRKIIISRFTIEGVTPPATNETAKTAIPENKEYKGTITWEPALDNGKFKADTVYTATINLTANTGFTLKGIKKNTFKVANGEAANGADSGVIKVKFPKTAAAAAGDGTDQTPPANNDNGGSNTPNPPEGGSNTPAPPAEGGSNTPAPPAEGGGEAAPAGNS